MGKKLTHDEFLAKVRDKNEHVRNGELEILDLYNGMDKKIKCCCCKHDYIWEVFPSDLYKGIGCKFCKSEKISCSKLKSHDEFVHKAIMKNKYISNGDIEILGMYIDVKTPVRCRCNVHDYIWDAHIDSLYAGCGCKYCGLDKLSTCNSLSYEDFSYRLSLMHNDIKLVGTYTNGSTHTEFKCKNGHVWQSLPTKILQGNGCPYCNGKQVLVGFNDMWTTRPDIAGLLNNSNDGYKYTYGSKKKLEFKCRLCGHIQEKVIKDVSLQGFSCNRCSDNLSYPNKFGRAFLDQLPIQNHQCEYHPDWAKPYFYDNYFEYKNNKYILEMDGGFHFQHQNVFGKSFEERKESDRIKDDLAANQGICVIRIDCRKSSCDYIKNTIINSSLNLLFDLSDIDWRLCDEMSHKSLIKETCDLYMLKIYELADIAKLLHISVWTVREYLKKGFKFGWCDYNTRSAMK